VEDRFNRIVRECKEALNGVFSEEYFHISAVSRTGVNNLGLIECSEECDSISRGSVGSSTIGSSVIEGSLFVSLSGINESFTHFGGLFSEKYNVKLVSSNGSIKISTR